jgi:hypothetical protein
VECSDRQAGELAPRPRLSGPVPASFQQGAYGQDSFHPQRNASAQDNRGWRNAQTPVRFDLRMQDSVRPVPLVVWATAPVRVSTAPAACKAAVFSKARSAEAVMAEEASRPAAEAVSGAAVGGADGAIQ